MRKIILLTLLLLSMVWVNAQTTSYLRADTVKVTNVSKTSNLVIENATRAVLGPLFNNGQGKTIFKLLGITDIQHLQDSLNAVVRKKDSSKYITPWQFHYGNNTIGGNWTFNNTIVSSNSVAISGGTGVNAFAYGVNPQFGLFNFISDATGGVEKSSIVFNYGIGTVKTLAYQPGFYGDSGLHWGADRLLTTADTAGIKSAAIAKILGLNNVWTGANTFSNQLNDFTGVYTTQSVGGHSLSITGSNIISTNDHISIIPQTGTYVAVTGGLRVSVAPTGATDVLRLSDTGTTALPSVYSLEHRNWNYYGTSTFHNGLSLVGATGITMPYNTITSTSGQSWFKATSATYGTGISFETNVSGNDVAVVFQSPGTAYPKNGIVYDGADNNLYETFDASGGYVNKARILTTKDRGDTTGNGLKPLLTPQSNFSLPTTTGGLNYAATTGSIIRPADAAKLHGLLNSGVGLNMYAFGNSIFSAIGIKGASPYGEANGFFKSSGVNNFAYAVMRGDDNFIPLDPNAFPIRDSRDSIYYYNGMISTGVFLPIPTHQVTLSVFGSSNIPYTVTQNGQRKFSQLTVYYLERTSSAAPKFDIVVNGTSTTTIDTYTDSVHYTPATTAISYRLAKATVSIPASKYVSFVLNNFRNVDRGSGIAADGTAYIVGFAFGNGLSFSNYSVSSTTLLDASAANISRGVTTTGQLAKATATGSKVYLIEWGVNDSKIDSVTHVPVSSYTAYKTYLSHKIDSLRGADSTATIILVGAPRGTGIYSYGTVYNKTMKSVAIEKNCSFIDIEWLFDTSPGLLSDAIHPSEAGHKTYGDYMATAFGFAPFTSVGSTYVGYMRNDPGNASKMRYPDRYNGSLGAIVNSGTVYVSTTSTDKPTGWSAAEGVVLTVTALNSSNQNVGIQTFYSNTTDSIAYRRNVAGTYQAWTKIPTGASGKYLKTENVTGPFTSDYAGDLNSITTQGALACTTGATNRPLSDGAGGIVITLGRSSANLRQIYLSANTGIQGMWFRAQFASVWGAWSQVAILASPTFTGTPAAPTAAVGTSTTQLATTAFVQAALPTYGTITLVAGVGTATVTGVSATSKATTGFVSVGGTVTTTWQYKVVCTTNTVTITAITNTGTTDITDTSTLNYAVKL